MTSLPSDLQRALASGDAVLWTGAGLGSLIGAPNWSDLLGALVEACDAGARPGLEDLLDQGRLQPVLSYINRHLGDEPLEDLMRAAISETLGETPARAASVARVPWRACIASVYPELLAKTLSLGGVGVDVVRPREAHELTLRGERQPFVLAAPVTTKSVRADQVFFDFIEEIVHTRTIVLVGVDIDDPDLQQVFGLLERVGRGRRHYACLPVVSSAEAEELLERFGVEVFEGGADELTQVFDTLAGAAKSAAGPDDPRSASESAGFALDLKRSLRGVHLRADFALDRALSLDPVELRELADEADRVKTQLPAKVALQVGSACFAHGDGARARKLFSQVITRNDSAELQALARFNLALLAAEEGDDQTAVESLASAAEAHRALALVPPRFSLEGVLGRRGARWDLVCRDRTNNQQVHLELSTLDHLSSRASYARFVDGAKKLATFAHPHMRRVAGGFADGQVFGLICEAIEGRSLADLIESRGRLSLENAFRVLGPVMDVLEQAHAEGLAHGFLHPREIWVTADGPRVRGWGLAPVMHYRRPSVQSAQRGYVAPELSRGESPTAASDVFALGALMYHALTGVVGEGGMVAPTLLVPELDPRLDGLLLGCLHPDPELRPDPAFIRAEIATIRTTPRAPSGPVPQAAAVEAHRLDAGLDSGPGARIPAPPASFGEALGDQAIDEEKPQTLRMRVGEEGPEAVLPDSPDQAEITTRPADPDSADAGESPVPDTSNADEPAKSADVAAPEPVSDRPSGVVRVELPEDPDDLEAWTWVLEQKPEHMEARTNLVRIEAASREAQRWDRVADCLRVRAELSQVQHERLAILRELAELLEGPLGAPAFALETLLSVLDELTLPARVGLAPDLLRLGRVTGRWQQVTAALQPIAESAPEPADRANLARSLARVYAEELGAIDRAHGMYVRAMELEPELVSLHEEAAELYRRHKRWIELAPVLLGLAELETGTRRNELLVEAAGLLADALEEPEAALETLESVRAEDPHFAPARELVTRLARELGRDDVMSQVLLDEAKFSEDEDGSAVAYAEYGRLRAEKFDDRAAAVGAWSESLKLRPDQPELRELRRVAQRKRVEAHEVPAIELAEIILGDAEACDALDDRVALWEEGARLFDAIDGAGSRATDCRERILSSLEASDPRVQNVVGALERSYADRQDAEALRQLYESRADAQGLDTPARIQAWTGLHALAIGPAPEASLARRALEALVELDPGEPKWRDALIERYLGDGDREAAAKLVEARAEAAGDASGRIEALIDLSSLQLADGKLEAAEAKLREALEIEPGRARVWDRLAEVQRRQGSADAAAQSEIRAAECGEDAGAFLKAARGARSVLGEKAQALNLLERAYAIDHHDPQIIEALLEARVEAGDLEKAAPLAYARVEHLEKLDTQGQGDRRALLSASALAGRCALRVGDRDGARKHLARARKLDASNFEVARLLADLQLESGQFEDALGAYQSVVLGATDLDDATRAEIYVKMSRCHREQDRDPKAAMMLQRALEIAPKHEGAIRALVEVAGDSQARVDAQQRLISLLDSGQGAAKGPDEGSIEEELLELRLAAAAGLADELDRGEEAAKLIEAGLEKHSDDPSLLHQLLELRTKAENWYAACEVLKSLAGLQEDPSAKAKYLYAGAVLLRDNVGDKDAALTLMREVLEADPLHDKAYRSSREMLEDKSDFKELSRMIRSRLKALPENASELRAELFDSLGALYEVDLHDPETALAAYEQAIMLGRRGEAEVQNKRVRHAYELAVEMGSDSSAKAIELAQLLIARRPMDFDAYHQLLRLFVAAKQRDGAVCVARALRFLKQATAQELELADAGDNQRVPPRGTLNAEQWRTGLLHPEHDPRLSEVFSLIWAVLAVRGGQTHAHLGLNRADKEQPSLQGNGVSKHIAHAAGVLDVALPELFTRPGQPGGIKVGALIDGQSVAPTALAGSDAIDARDEAALAFRCGRAMARMSPANLAALIVPNGPALKDVVLGSWLVVDPSAPLPADSRNSAANVAEAINRLLPASHKDHLGGAMGRVLEAGYEPARWLRGVEFTCTRAGLLMADSLDAAARTISVGSSDLGGVPATDLVKDLVAYSVSAQYLRLRKLLKQAR
jgi:Tfp pilus assembly protein PilF